MSDVQGSRTVNSDRPLSERVIEQFMEITGEAFYLISESERQEIAALEAERDRWEHNYLTVEAWYDNLKDVINRHANDCVKCGDCGFWQQFERPLEGGE